MNSLNPDILPFIGIAPSREIPVAADAKVRIPADDKGPSRLVKASSPTGKTFAGPSLGWCQRSTHLGLARARRVVQRDRRDPQLAHLG